MNYFIENQISRKIGTKEIINFYDCFCKLTIEYLKKYFNNFPKDYKEHGFDYGEQQFKTFLTLALGKLTNYYVIQENPINRRIIDKIDNKKNSTSVGRVDYWATYKNSTYLIEVKHGMIKFNSKNDILFYNYLKDLLKKSMEQIDNVENKISYNYSMRMFGLGLLVAPIFYDISKDKKTPILTFDAVTKNFLQDSAFKMGFNICSLWRIPNNYIKSPLHYDSKQYGILGLAFLGKFKKLTKK